VEWGRVSGGAWEVFVLRGGDSSKLSDRWANVRLPQTTSTLFDSPKQKIVKHNYINNEFNFLNIQEPPIPRITTRDEAIDSAYRRTSPYLIQRPRSEPYRLFDLISLVTSLVTYLLLVDNGLLKP